MAHPNLWGTTDTRNGLPTTTRESPDFSHGECQTIKTLICILFNRQGDLWGKDHIDVAILNHRPAYTMEVMGGYDWNCIVVGYGYFKN